MAHEFASISNYLYLTKVINIPIAAAPIPINVAQTKRFEIHPLLYSPIIFLFLAFKPIIKIKGTATTPLITAAITKALIGSNPIKLIIKPISVAMVITP